MRLQDSWRVRPRRTVESQNRRPMTGRPVDFERWCTEVALDAGPELKGWLRELFEREGPVSKEAAGSAYLLAQIDLAERCVSVVLRDLHRTSGKRPDVAVDDLEERVRITVDGGYQTPSMMAAPWDQTDALVEVADYLQGEVMGNEGPAWPVCPTHDLGLHPLVVADRAVWWCEPTSHEVAEIGTLGRTS